jgi:hypothetical protein
VSPHIPYEEEDALRRILAHHGIDPNRKLVSDLSELIKWVHEAEQAKSAFDGKRPPILMAKLSTMGIFGSEAIGPSPTGGKKK